MMTIFDIGFFDGKDSEYYLKKGYEVVAFEADPALCEIASHKYAEFIENGQLKLLNLAIGPNPGNSIEFYIHKDSREWSTMYKEAAVNWGTGKFDVIEVACITPREMFSSFGIPYYLKSDIEGFDIYIAEHLQHLTIKPEYCSFEYSDPELLTYLIKAGYESFQFIDQAFVPNQVTKTINGEHIFEGGSGPFGEDLQTPWLSASNASYLSYRFNLDPFGSSLPKGHWYDLHASYRKPVERNVQIDYLRDYISRLEDHCGIQAFNKPLCPYSKLQ